MPLPQRFLESLRAGLTELMGTRCLVALSGGSDSVALLRLLHAVQDQSGMTLAAAHVHHHTRGTEAEEDVLFCHELCQGLGIDLRVLHLSPDPPRGVSPEAWWRRERYRLLQEEAHRQGCAAIVTGHTLDDQAETVIIKLAGGGGPRAAGGIRRRRGMVARPLLAFRREELRAWLRSTGSAWREDATNADPSRPRGFVRHDLLPLLEERFPNASSHLAAFAAIAAADEEVLASHLREQAVWPRIGVGVAVETVRSLATGLRARWVLELASRLPLAEPPSRVQLAAVEAMLAAGEPAAVDLGRRWVLRRRADRLYICPPPCPPFSPTPVREPGELVLSGGFVVRVGCSDPAHDGHRVVVRAELRRRSVCWRSPRAGERWPHPSGARLTRLLARAGVPAEWRRAWPLLEADGTILWVPALGVASGWEGQGDGVPVEVEEPWRRQLRLSRLM